jgi:hypothetical protein
MHLFSFRVAAVAGTLLALLSLVAGPAVQAEPLGRLFLSPAERARIDRPPADTPAPPPPRLDGIVTRSAGRPMLFLDGQATLADPHRVHIEDATARVTGPDGRQHRLRVGDSPLNTGAP